jgi:Uma2 family endonuclease
MPLDAEKNRFSIGDYLNRERVAVDKHEFRDGEIVMMSGGSRNHSLIIANTIAALHGKLKGGPCNVYDGNLRIRIPRRVLYTYPDLSVICGKAEPDPDDPAGETIINPRMIFEVLSPSTEAYDRGEKFTRYQLLDSLAEYVLVSQSEPRVESFFRQPDGTWLLTPISGVQSIAPLRCLNVSLALSEIYAGVDFPASSAAADHI